MQRLIFKVSFLLILCTSEAQTVKWVVHEGGLYDEKCTGMTVDMDGNIFIIGTFENSTDFGGQIINGEDLSEIYIAKYGADGTFRWIRGGIGQGIAGAHGIVTDQQGNVYVCGQFKDTMQLDMHTTLTTNGSFDPYLAKYAPDGQLVWVRKGITTGASNANDLSIDDKGNIYMVGEYSGEIRLGDTILINGSHRHVYLAKYSNDGLFQWVRTTMGYYRHNANGVALDQEGSIYVGGHFDTIIHFIYDSVYLWNQGWGTDLFLAKYDQEGNFQWVEHMPSTIDGNCEALLFNGHHQLLFLANYQGDVHFGNHILNHNLSFTDGIAQYDLDKKKWEWAIIPPGDLTFRVQPMAVDPAGHIYTTGNMTHDIVFGSDTVKKIGLYDILVSHFNPEGNNIWVNNFGGTDFTMGTAICTDAHSNIYIAGNFEDTLTVGGNVLTNQGSKDLFITKISSVNFTPSIEQATLLLNVNPNPCQGLVQIHWPFSNWKGRAVASVYNINGQLVYEKILSDRRQTWTIDLGHLAKGMYLVKTELDNYHFCNKIIVQ